MNRRRFLAGLSALVLSASVAACADTGGAGQSGASGDGGASTLSADTSAEISLAYWDKAQTPTIEANIASFNKKYPNIKVTTNLAVYKEYWQKLRTQAEGSTLPDVMWMNGPNIQLYAENGLLLPFDDATSYNIKWEDYPSALVDLYTVNGTHYGIPKDFDTIAVFYNKKIFEQAGVPEPKAGWTWEDFHAAAKKISEWGKDKGIWGCATTINGDGQGTYYNTILQAGGYIIKDGKSGFDDPKSIEGLQFWADLVADGSVAPPAIVSDTKPTDMFNSGKTAMMWAGDWEAPEIAEAYAGRLGEINVVELPKKEKQATVIHGLSWVVSKDTKNVEAAKALAAHMASKESQETEAKNGTAIPAFNGTQEPWIASYPDWNVHVFVDAAATYAVPYPVSKNTDVWSNAEADYVIPAFAGEKPVKEQAVALASFMNDALSKEK